MKFEINDYDLQAEGTCGDFQWMLHNGNLWVYKDWEDAEYDYRIETEIQIEPFVVEEEIKNAVEAIVLSCILPTNRVYMIGSTTYCWKASMKKKYKLSAHQKMMIAMWAKKMKESLERPLLFNKLFKE